MDDATYHADLLRPEPTMSSGLLRVFLRSPLHAWYAHPRLNPSRKPFHSNFMDLGSLAHALVLGSGAEIHVVEADSWRGAAGTARREARSKNAIAVLAKDLPPARRLAEKTAEFLDAAGLTHERRAAGLVEQTLLWRDPSGAWCRCKPDLLLRDERLIVDLKTTSKSAGPEGFRASARQYGYDWQAAFYSMGFKALFGELPRFLFVAVETEEPYVAAVHSYSQELINNRISAISAALADWQQCLTTNNWPGYKNTVHCLD